MDDRKAEAAKIKFKVNHYIIIMFKVQTFITIPFRGEPDWPSFLFVSSDCDAV